MSQMAAFATGIPPDIYAFHRYTRNSTISLILKTCRIKGTSQVEPGSLTPDVQVRLRTLYTQ